MSFESLLLKMKLEEMKKVLPARLYHNYAICEIGNNMDNQLKQQDLDTFFNLVKQFNDSLEVANNDRANK